MPKGRYAPEFQLPEQIPPPLCLIPPEVDFLLLTSEKVWIYESRFHDQPSPQ